MNSYVRVVTLLLTLTAAAGVRAADPDAEGFIHEWLMLAPIDISEDASGGEAIVKSQIPDEGKLAPKEGDTVKVKGKDMKWKKITAKDYYFDVNELLGEMLSSVAGYFVVYIDAPEELKDVKLQMGSNDEGRAYLNEKAVITFAEGRTIDKDQDSAVVTLNKGVNKIVFKVINDSNNWQGCIRFTDKDGKPVKNYTTKLAP